MAISLESQCIWLTGASTGIGYALAIALAESGAKVAVSARSADKLQALARQYPDNLLACPCDVTKPETLQAVVQNIREQFGQLDMLITNAGTCEYLDVEHWDSKMIEGVMTSNFMGTVYPIEAALPLMKSTAKQGRPRIVGMCSLAVCLPFARAEAYGASKAAVRYFLDSLRVDLATHGIDVTTIYPGFVKTPLTDRNTFHMPDLISADEATQYIMKGLQKGASHIYFPWRFATILRFLSVLPAQLKHRLSNRL